MAAAKALTIDQARRAFGVSAMTLWLWRRGTATKEPLPFVVVDPSAEKPRVGFPLRSTETWARRHGIAFVQPPSAVLAADAANPRPAAAGKSGPKPRLMAAGRKPGH